MTLCYSPSLDATLLGNPITTTGKANTAKPAQAYSPHRRPQTRASELPASPPSAAEAAATTVATTPNPQALPNCMEVFKRPAASPRSSLPAADDRQRHVGEPETCCLQVATPTAPVSQVRFVGGLYERCERHNGHDGHEEEPDKDRHERERYGPPDKDGAEPCNLIEDGSQRVRGHSRRIVLVDQPDHERRNRPEKSRKQVQEGAQMDQRRPRALVLDAHHTRPRRLEPRAVLVLDPVVPRVSLHLRSFLTVANRVYAGLRQRFRPPCGRARAYYFPFPLQCVIIPVPHSAFRRRHICGTSIYN